MDRYLLRAGDSGRIDDSALVEAAAIAQPDEQSGEVVASMTSTLPADG